MGRAEDEVVKNVRQGEKTPHQYDYQRDDHPEKTPSEFFQVIPEGHIRHLFRLGSILYVFLDFVEFLFGLGHAGLETLDALA